MSRKQIGLRMKDETRDLLERVRGSLSRTDYIEGAVLAQIARDLKKTVTVGVDIPGEAISVITDDRMPKDMVMPIPQTVQEGELRDGSRIEDGDVYDTSESSPFDKAPIMTGYPLDASEQMAVDRGMERIEKEKALFSGYSKGWPVRSSAESKAGVLPVPKKAVKGRK